jgi:3-hydroxyisobutyrate dehydrogenase-like beta-hydroxyacid dehydrogenase
MARVAFIGLGAMGSPMAGHLVAAGHEVTVYNRTRSKADAWVGQHGGGSARTPAAAADGAELVMTCVGNDDDVRAVVQGDDGALATMAAGSILVDHTTTSAVLARDVAALCAENGVGFVDAPVSGGQAGAENGALTVMCGADDDAVFATAQAVIDAYAAKCARMGSVGAGQLTKMVNQICIAGVVQGLAEAVDFTLRAGLDAAHVFDVIGKGAAQSWQLDNRAATMAAGEFDFGFAVEWMRKDLGFCLAEAHRLGGRLPVAALVDQFYAQVEQRGGKRWDTSSLVQLLREP